MAENNSASWAIDGVFTGSIQPFGDDQSPSAIIKQPVLERVSISTLGIAGDQQADKRVHGGPDKAVHHYAADNYISLANTYPASSRIWKAGLLGENISTTGITETDISVGDVFSLGSAVVQVSQPRSPCWKVDERTGIPRLSIHIAENALSGWYYRVLETGDVQVGETLRLIEKSDCRLSLHDLWTLYLTHRPSLHAMEEALEQAALSNEWRHRLTSRLQWLKKNTRHRKPTE